MNAVKPLEATTPLTKSTSKQKQFVVIKNTKSEEQCKLATKPEEPEYYYDFVGIAG